jgi:hypothetical protein
VSGPALRHTLSIVHWVPAAVSLGCAADCSCDLLQSLQMHIAVGRLLPFMWRVCILRSCICNKVTKLLAGQSENAPLICGRGRDFSFLQSGFGAHST